MFPMHNIMYVFILRLFLKSAPLPLSGFQCTFHCELSKDIHEMKMWLLSPHFPMKKHGTSVFNFQSTHLIHFLLQFISLNVLSLFFNFVIFLENWSCCEEDDTSMLYQGKVIYVKFFHCSFPLSLPPFSSACV